MAEQQPNVHYVVFHKPGPQWQEGIAFRAQPTISEHIQHFASLLEAGQLAMGGPFLDASGGMMVTTAGVTAAEIEALAAADPSVQAGVLLYEARPWLMAMTQD